MCLLGCPVRWEIERCCFCNTSLFWLRGLNIVNNQYVAVDVTLVKLDFLDWRLRMAAKHAVRALQRKALGHPTLADTRFLLL